MAFSHYCILVLFWLEFELEEDWLLVAIEGDAQAALFGVKDSVSLLSHSVGHIFEPALLTLFFFTRLCYLSLHCSFAFSSCLSCLNHTLCHTSHLSVFLALPINNAFLEMVPELNLLKGGL